MAKKNNQNLTQGEQPQAPEVQEQPKTPPEVTGYEGTGHEKDPFKTKPSTGYEGTK